MIYIHVPFCRSFCTYCGFYSEICSREASQQVQNRVFDAYVDAIIAEVAVGAENVCCADPSHLRWAPPSSGAEGGTVPAPTATSAHALSTSGDPSDVENGTDSTTSDTSAHAPITSLGKTAPETLYFGGGTPSVLPLRALERIVKALGKREYQEFTIEVNPDDIVTNGIEYVRGLVALGVNRVSMGVQSFDDGILRWMNRRHGAAQALEAYALLRQGGITNVSIDLIFGL